MSYATDIDDINTNTTGRVLRAASGIGLACVALTGFWSHPWALFALFSASVYLTISAIIGKGLWDVFFKSEAEEGGNVARSERAGRGVTAGVTLGTVISGALLLEPIDMFVLLLVGMYSGASAIMGWDPVRALFGGRETGGEGVTRPIPAIVGQTGVGGTGQVADRRAA